MYHKQLLASGVCENTICFYLHNIKALYRKGCQEMGLEQPSPFREVHFKTEKTVKRCLETDVTKSYQTGTGGGKYRYSCTGYLHVQFLYSWNVIR